MSDEAKGLEPTQTDGQVPDETTEPTEPQLDAAAIQAELKRARNDAAKYRTELRKFQEADEERKRAAMSETDKLKADLEAMRAQAAAAQASSRQAQIRSSIVSAASKVGFMDTEDVVRELARGELELDGDTVKGVDELVADLAARKPYWVKRPGQSSPTNPSGQSKLSMDAIKRMSTAEINANWDAVQEALQSKT